MICRCGMLNDIDDFDDFGLQMILIQWILMTVMMGWDTIMGTDDGWQPKLRIGNIAKVISVTKCNTVVTSVKKCNTT